MSCRQKRHRSKSRLPIPWSNGLTDRNVCIPKRSAGVMNRRSFFQLYSCSTEAVNGLASATIFPDLLWNFLGSPKASNNHAVGVCGAHSALSGFATTQVSAFILFTFSHCILDQTGNCQDQMERECTLYTKPSYILDGNFSMQQNVAEASKGW